MPSALLVRFRPASPWRLGPDNGAKDRTDHILHSDAVYSALTIAMRDLGWLEDWIAVTTSADPVLRLTSCYPWTGRLLMIEPPRSLWPVAQTGKLRWKVAKFVPASLIPALVRGESLKEDQWAVDPVSECLLPVTRNGPMHPPFRVAKRRFAAVDRETGTSESAREVACMQFAPSSGMWFAAVFSSDRARDQWTGKLRSACRLLADSGLGGGKSAGWGRSDDPRFETVGDWNRMLTGAEGEIAGESAWWLLSLFSPGESDAVDWKRGNYGVCVRSGRVSGTGDLKKPARLVAEGSVLLSAAEPTGLVKNVAPEGAEHPVYRSGLAVAVPIPWKESRRLPWMPTESEPVAVVPATVEGVEPVPASVDEQPLEESPGTEAAPVTESFAPVAPVDVDTVVGEPVNPAHVTALPELADEPLALPAPVAEPPVSAAPVHMDAVVGEPVNPANLAALPELAGEPLALPAPVAEPPVSAAPVDMDAVVGEPVNPAHSAAPSEPGSTPEPAGEPPADPAPVEEPPSEEPPATEPGEPAPVTEPPVSDTLAPNGEAEPAHMAGPSDPDSTPEPAGEPPADPAPVREPPSEEPPATEPGEPAPVTEPPSSDATAGERVNPAHMATSPDPGSTPEPAGEPPVDPAPVEEPPSEEPPATEPGEPAPVTEPPTESGGAVEESTAGKEERKTE